MKSLKKSYKKPHDSPHLSLCPVIIYVSAQSSFKPENSIKSLLFCNWEHVIFSVYIVIQNPLVNHHIVV